MAVTVPLGPVPVDLKGVRAGDRNQFTASISISGAPADLTGYTITAQARKKSTDQGAPAISAVVEVLDAPNGLILVRWPGADVTTLLGTSAAWAGVWDLQVATGGQEPVTILAGKFAAEQDVTRP